MIQIALLFSVAAVITLSVLLYFCKVKIQNLLNELVKVREINNKYTAASANCQIVIVEDNEESLGLTLGISNERADYLLEKANEVKESIHGKDGMNISEFMVEYSKYLKHPNEVAFTFMQVGATFARQMKSLMDDIRDMLKD